VSGAARNHLALLQDLAMRTYDFLPFGARPSVSIACLTSQKRLNGPRGKLPTL